jgi:hypothetical protein
MRGADRGCARASSDARPMSQPYLNMSSGRKSGLFPFVRKRRHRVTTGAPPDDGLCAGSALSTFSRERNGGVRNVRNRRDRGAGERAKPRGPGPDERRDDPPGPRRGRRLGVSPRRARVECPARPSPPRDPRSLGCGGATDGGPGDGARHRLQRRDLQLHRAPRAARRRRADVRFDRRHRRPAPRTRRARPRRAPMGAGDVRVRRLEPGGAAPPARPRPARDEATLPRAEPRSRGRVVGRLRLGAARAARVGAARDAPPRSARRRVRRVERLRRRLEHRRSGRGAPLARAPRGARRQGPGAPRRRFLHPRRWPGERAV